MYELPHTLLILKQQLSIKCLTNSNWSSIVAMADSLESQLEVKMKTMQELDIRRLKLKAEIEAVE